jgi:hypothetical protein
VGEGEGRGVSVGKAGAVVEIVGREDGLGSGEAMLRDSVGGVDGEAAVSSGVLVALGNGVSGRTQPHKVKNRITQSVRNWAPRLKDVRSGLVAVKPLMQLL